MWITVWLLLTGRMHFTPGGSFWCVIGIQHVVSHCVWNLPLKHTFGFPTISCMCWLVFWTKDFVWGPDKFCVLWLEELHVWANRMLFYFPAQIYMGSMVTGFSRGGLWAQTPDPSHFLLQNSIIHNKSPLTEHKTVFKMDYIFSCLCKQVCHHTPSTPTGKKQKNKMT